MDQSVQEIDRSPPLTYSFPVLDTLIPKFPSSVLLSSSAGGQSCFEWLIQWNWNSWVAGWWSEVWKGARKIKAASCRGCLMKWERCRRTGDGGWNQLLQNTGQEDGGRRKQEIKEFAFEERGAKSMLMIPSETLKPWFGFSLWSDVFTPDLPAEQNVLLCH